MLLLTPGAYSSKLLQILGIRFWDMDIPVATLLLFRNLKGQQALHELFVTISFTSEASILT